MGLARLHKDLRRGAPDHHQPVAAVRLLEVADVLANRLGELQLVRRLLDVRAVEALDVVVVEDRRHRLDSLQEVGDRFDVVVAVQHAGLEGGFVGVVGDRVPGAEDELVEPGQRHELVDQRRLALGTFAEANGAHLRQRADRLRGAAPGVLDAGDEGRGNGAEPGEQHSELAFGGGDVMRICGDEVFGFQDDSFLTGERHEGHVPLRGDAPGARPVLDRALALAEEVGQRCLAAEALDDASGGGGGFGNHTLSITKFSLFD